MDKLASTKYPIHELLQRRWSPVAFSRRPVEPEKLGSMLEAARWTASCFNEQPWNYIIATQENPAEFDRLLGCLVEANQEWAKNAPVLMLSVAKLFFERNGNENKHAWHDLGAASANLTVQAMALGLYVHQMAGFDSQKARDVFNIPEGYDPVAAIAVGYLGNPQELSEKLYQREVSDRSRKPLEGFIFEGNWGQTYNLSH